MSIHLTALSLASIALFALTAPAQDAVKLDAVKLEIAPATLGDDGSMLIAVGDNVKLTATTGISPSEVHIWAFPPANNLASLDLKMMVIVHQEFLFQPGSIGLDFVIPKEAEGLGVSLLAVAFDEKGLANPSNLLTVFVKSDKAQVLPADQD